MGTPNECSRLSWVTKAARVGVGLALVLGVGFTWAASAHAQTVTSGSISPGPDCCQTPPADVGNPNEVVHIAVKIQSTSQISGVFVDATVSGTTQVILGCTSSSTSLTCTGTELAALTFDSCTPAAGVTACLQDGGNANHVLITYPAGGKIVSSAPGGTLVATITAHFTLGQEIHTPASGQFFVLADTGAGNLDTASAEGSAGGAGPLFFPGFCGDGVVDAGEACDDGNTNNTDSCRNNCTIPRCGDGIVDAGEQCDDGNTNNTDSCRNNCTIPVCGDGIVDPGEACDDGNSNDLDSCPNNCIPHECGDGIVDAGEQCDDGNNVSGDGCSAACEIEREVTGCRITAGGINPQNVASTFKSTFGGQVGAPCGCIGNFDEFDHIQGNWTHSRKKQAGSFHALNFNSLVCGCDLNGTDGEARPILDGVLCGDRIVGPTPPVAPANIACFSGVGGYVAETGKRATRVAFRVDVQDRGEPAVKKASPFDVYRIRIWIPESGETAAGLVKDVACTEQLDAHFGFCSAVRAPNIDDGETLVNGNIQIHPQIASHTDICPVPSETCPDLAACEE